MNISLVGTGNAAHQLGLAFSLAGINVQQIYGRNANDGEKLAKKVNGKFQSIQDLKNCQSEMVLLAVSDTAITELSTICPVSCLVLHCSGASSIDELITENSGVFYPLQTMSKGQKVDFTQTPVLLECRQNQHQFLLEKLASSISKSVYWIDSHERLKIHLAAVFACNFSNDMMTVATNYLESEKLPGIY